MHYKPIGYVHFTLPFYAGLTLTLCEIASNGIFLCVLPENINRAGLKSQLLISLPKHFEPVGDIHFALQVNGLLTLTKWLNESLPGNIDRVGLESVPS